MSLIRHTAQSDGTLARCSPRVNVHGLSAPTAVKLDAKEHLTQESHTLR